ncbi:MAG: phage major capsid protein, partial [Sporichthyaceae bacterium]|nr:phage major capsid protein [Sporichthyaceae bacterium]
MSVSGRPRIAIPPRASASTPRTPDELSDYLADARNSKRLADPAALAEFVQAYAKAANAADPGIEKQVSEQVQAELASFLRDNGAPAGVRRPNVDPNPKRPAGRAGTLYNRRAIGARADKLFETSGDYFHGIWHNNKTPDGDKLAALHNMGSIVPSDGGFLVPERLRSELLAVSLETSIVRPRAFVIPMDSQRVPVPAVDDASHTGSVLGGVVGYWTEEGALLTKSDPKFGRVVLDAKKLDIYTEVPNELVQDAGSTLSGFLDQVLPLAISFFEDDAFMTGSGAGEPLGFLNGGAALSVAKETGQVAATIVWENIIKMFSRMLPGSLNRAVWIASIDTFPELATMGLSVGTGGGPVWIGWTAGNSAADAPPMTILGRPVFFTEKTPVVGTVGDISFVDLGYYLIGDRQAMTATSSEH